MSESSVSTLRDTLLRLSNSIANSLAATPYTSHKTSNIFVKAFLEPLLTSINSTINASIKDFALACALLSSSTHANSEFLSWIPDHLSSLATASFLELSQAYLTVFDDRNSQKESAIDKSEESDEFSAASARVPVGFGILAAHQLRWFVTQIDYPHLGKLCGWAIPCALTAVDHWSPEVKVCALGLVWIKKIIKAYQYSTITSVTLLDCWKVPWVILLTWIFLGTRYSLWQLFGGTLCVLGLSLVLLSDTWNGGDGGGSKIILGDELVIVGTVFYAISNVGEEFCVKKKDRVEVVAMLGVYGFLVTAVEVYGVSSFIFYSFAPFVLKLSFLLMNLFVT
ncbi:unnamed protein product [Vicia faba]|uniref:Uncharacterized protein n=1 Tax=Vicia faba TaxID=3906 RepID=A0AAV0YHW9_VICFA|nr:unnamed protein product [Vicia faba]